MYIVIQMYSFSKTDQVVCILNYQIANCVCSFKYDTGNQLQSIYLKIQIINLD